MQKKFSFKTSSYDTHVNVVARPPCTPSCWLYCRRQRGIQGRTNSRIMSTPVIIIFPTQIFIIYNSKGDVTRILLARGHKYVTLLTVTIPTRCTLTFTILSTLSIVVKLKLANLTSLVCFLFEFSHFTSHFLYKGITSLFRSVNVIT